MVIASFSFQFFTCFQLGHALRACSQSFPLKSKPGRCSRGPLCIHNEPPNVCDLIAKSNVSARMPMNLWWNRQLRSAALFRVDSTTWFSLMGNWILHFPCIVQSNSSQHFSVTCAALKCIIIKSVSHHRIVVA